KGPQANITRLFKIVQITESNANRLFAGSMESLFEQHPETILPMMIRSRSDNAFASALTNSLQNLFLSIASTVTASFLHRSFTKPVIERIWPMHYYVPQDILETVVLADLGHSELTKLNEKLKTVALPAARKSATRNRYFANALYCIFTALLINEANKDNSGLLLLAVSYFAGLLLLKG